jgi:hypothetical protein
MLQSADEAGITCERLVLKRKNDDVAADEPDELLIRSRVRIIVQWDMLGAPFIEYRIYGERFAVQAR